MRFSARHSRFVYTRSTIYAFHAGLVVIPELAVLPKKRFWSRQINNEKIWNIVKGYRPEELLLSDDSLDPQVSNWIASEYVRAYFDGKFSLYVFRKTQ